MKCPRCGHHESTISGTNRRMCRSCRKSFPADGRYVRPPTAPLPKERCPKCGVADHPISGGSGNSRLKSCCRHCGHKWTRGAHAVDAPQPARDDVDVFVWTCAVNDTPVFGQFLRAMEGYVAHRRGSLGVIPIRYKNPTSQREAEQPITYAKQVVRYLVETRQQLCRGLQVLADIRPQPTAVNPLASMEGLTGTDSCIVGHPRIALEPVATRGHELPKLVWTTGAVTRPNYSRTLAGGRGEFNHVYGALVVEIDRRRGIFHVRSLLATSSGSFIDLDTEYLPDGTNRPSQPALALVLGDGHAEKADPNAVRAAREQQAVVKPRRLVWHDVYNHGSGSHHNTVWERFKRRVTGTDRVLDELHATAALIDSFHVRGQETVVVSSNHHDHLGRWLADSRNGDDMQNAGIYHRAKAAVMAEIERLREIPDIFGLVLAPMLKHHARFLTERDSYAVAGIELAYHGDKGPNGAKGSAKSLNKIGVKSIIGHSHSPRIVGGCYQTGTLSLLDMGYNTGPSSWLHSNVVIYANGKRTHLHSVGAHGEWRLDDGQRSAAGPAAAGSRRAAGRTDRRCEGGQAGRAVRGGGSPCRGRPRAPAGDRRAVRKRR